MRAQRSSQLADEGHWATRVGLCGEVQRHLVGDQRDEIRFQDARGDRDIQIGGGDAQLGDRLGLKFGGEFVHGLDGGVSDVGCDGAGHGVFQYLFGFLGYIPDRRGT